MKISLKPQHLKRYRDIARLLLKYGRSDLIHHIEWGDALEEEGLLNERHAAKPEELVDDLERMGPTYVKLGQLLAARPDLFPDRYLKALGRLQDRVKPFPAQEVEQIIQAELNARVNKAFAEFDPVPLASASLGQVHRATLRDGRAVVVKVQRPGIRREIIADMEVLEEIAGFLDDHSKRARRYQFVRIIEEFKISLLRELDYHREASNLAAMAENLAEFERIQVPLPVAAFTTRSVLTMEYVRGCKITSISPVVRLEIEGEVLAEELFRAYLKQVLVDGLFHADPHPGNVFLTEDKKIALLDLGMVGRLTPSMQERLLRLLVSIAEGASEDACDLMLEISETHSDFDEARFRRRASDFVAEQFNNTLQGMQFGRTLFEVARTAGDCGLYVPTELTLLGKTLLQLDEIGRSLNPKFNPNASVRRRVLELLHRRMRRDFRPGKIFASMWEARDFVSRLPARVSKILDAIANAELEVRVRTTDVQEVITTFQKMANRVTAGLILAALIVGASLMMQVETEFKILGLPGVAILFFLIAAGGGLWLVFNILMGDQPPKKK